MREYLFRGKHKDNGKWIEGDLTQDRDIGTAYISGWDYYTDGDGLQREQFGCEVISETVGEFTGLTDKNGVKIFEGDIVRYQFDTDDCPFPNKHTEKIIGRILFSDWRASFSVTAGKYGSDVMNNDLFNYVRNGNRVEVIGNIHDNPELLKEASE